MTIVYVNFPINGLINSCLDKSVLAAPNICVFNSLKFSIFILILFASVCRSCICPLMLSTSRQSKHNSFGYYIDVFLLELLQLAMELRNSCWRERRWWKDEIMVSKRNNVWESTYSRWSVNESFRLVGTENLILSQFSVKYYREMFYFRKTWRLYWSETHDSNCSITLLYTKCLYELDEEGNDRRIGTD